MSAPQDPKPSPDIKDLEARLKVFISTLETLEIEINQLEVLQEGIKDNLSFLKREGIIVIASKYKEVKQNLLNVKSRLAKIRMDKDNIIKAKKEIEESIKKIKTEYALQVVGPNNILKFRGRNGPK